MAMSSAASSSGVTRSRITDIRAGRSAMPGFMTPHERNDGRTALLEWVAPPQIGKPRIVSVRRKELTAGFDRERREKSIRH